MTPPDRGRGLKRLRLRRDSRLRLSWGLVDLAAVRVRAVFVDAGGAVVKLVRVGVLDAAGSGLRNRRRQGEYRCDQGQQRELQI